MECSVSLISEEDILRIFWNIDDLYDLGNRVYNLLLEEKKKELSMRDPGKIFIELVCFFFFFLIYHFL